ncbi:MAG: BMP family ABC transporter substrate-binding protein, partial [Burkholderiaceae bacterium]|nr:BMP family ABC transporter substrate-binding protein [Burkholderiaceae bacterium]
KAHLTASTLNWNKYYIDSVKAVMAGTWKSSEVRDGIKEGMIKMSPLNPVVPADVAKLFEEKKAALAADKLNPFQGPIMDQAGAIKVAAGSVVSLNDLKSMNFYVKGVEGTIPK